MKIILQTMTELTKYLTKNLIKLALLSVLNLSLISLSFAQTATISGPPAGPGGACPGNTCPTPGNYPGSSWSFVAPAGNTKAVPTIDQNSAYYLPYLPWIASNVAALVNYSDFFYQLAKNNNGNGANVPYMNNVTTSANNYLSQTQISNMQTSANQTQQNIQQFLSFDPNNANFFAKLPLLPGTDIVVPCTQGSKCPTLPDDSSFNADSIFGVTNYPALQQDGKTPTPQAQSINNLILFMSNITQPIPSPGLSTDQKTLNTQLTNSQVQSYLLKIRTLAALQSMALSNFNYLAQERKIIPGLGTNAGMTVIPTSTDQCSNNPQQITDASQLQLDKYLLDRRLSNPCWYASMNSASPAAVARETLYVMVEIQRQLYETQMLNERVLATLSTMQMAMTQMGGGANLSITAGNVKSCLTNPSTCGTSG